MKKMLILGQIRLALPRRIRIDRAQKEIGTPLILFLIILVPGKVRYQQKNCREVRLIPKRITNNKKLQYNFHWKVFNKFAKLTKKMIYKFTELIHKMIMCVTALDKKIRENHWQKNWCKCSYYLTTVPHTLCSSALVQIRLSYTFVQITLKL